MQHKTLEDGRWAAMPFVEQMANIGSEVLRTSKWKIKGKSEYAAKAFERALELFDLTIRYGRLSDGRKGRVPMLREVCRLREVFCECYLSENQYAVASLDKYFMHFGIAARRSRRPE